MADYLALRRALGYKLAADERLLRQFLGFMKANDAKVITTALALKWATLPSGASPGWLSQRLSAVRGFGLLAVSGSARRSGSAAMTSSSTRRGRLAWAACRGEWHARS